MLADKEKKKEKAKGKELQSARNCEI